MANLKDTQNDQRPMFNKVSTKNSPGSHTPSQKNLEVWKKHWGKTRLGMIKILEGSSIFWLPISLQHIRTLINPKLLNCRPFDGFHYVARCFKMSIKYACNILKQTRFPYVFPTCFTGHVCFPIGFPIFFSVQLVFPMGWKPGQSQHLSLGSPTGLCTERPDVDDLPVIYGLNKWLLIEDR